MEHPSTAAAFTAAGLDAHAAPEPEEKREGLDPKHASEQKKKLKKQEELWMNHRKKTPPKKLNFSTARFLKYETAADTEGPGLRRGGEGVQEIRVRGAGLE
ncbi:MAG TPA: hypothetical protein P5525_21760 [Candidatus Paceibacterota bacterium]|nr:hypothetical protein [Candidatus Paceibacterota bacterium]